MPGKANQTGTSQVAKGSGSAFINQVAGNQVINTWNIGVSPAECPVPGGFDGGVRLARPVADLDDPYALEVHPAVTLDGRDTEAPQHLPRYIPREHDRRLAAVVARAAAGSSAIAVLVADSSSGKTRACWEAIRALGARSGWRLWHPINPGRPQALLAGLRAIEPHTVLWLNEAQHYLLTEGSDLGERAAAGLRELLNDPARAPVLVLGTLWTSFYTALTAEPGLGHDAHAQARALLTGAQIEVPSAFTGDALQAARSAAVHDPRVALAVRCAEDGRIAQFLAGAPELERRYRTAEPGVRALIEAAMDTLRLGCGPLIPHSLLRSAAPGYIADAQWQNTGDDWLDAALAECARPSRGTRGPLTAPRTEPCETPPPEPVYRLADHLEQVGRRERSDAAVPASLWTALLNLAPAENCRRLGLAAEERGYYRYAVKFYLRAHDPAATTAAADLLARTRFNREALACYQRAAEAGDAKALWAVARVLQHRGRDDEAIEYYRRVDQADAIERYGARRALAELLLRAGRTEEAIDYYRRAGQGRGNQSDRSAVQAAARLLHETGRTGEAIAWLTSRAEIDVTSTYAVVKQLQEMQVLDEALDNVVSRAQAGGAAALTAARMLDTAGRTDEALGLLNAVTDAGDALMLAGHMLKRRGRTTEAIRYYQRADEAGCTQAIRAAADALNKTGRIKEALDYYERAVETGDRQSQQAAARMLVSAGRTRKAIRWLNSYADCGDRDALFLAIYVLEQAGRINEAISYGKRAVQAGHVGARGLLAGLLLRAGRTEEALTHYRRTVDGNVLHSPREAARTMALAGQIDEAVSCYRRAAQCGDAHSLNSAAGLLVAQGRTEDAVAWLHACADEALPLAIHALVNLLRKIGRSDEAEHLRRYGRELDGTICAPWPDAGIDVS